MQVLRLNRNDEEFYALLGPVFGSRRIEQQTRDRFYDDPGKLWYVIPGQGVASVLDEKVKNFWAVSEEVAEALISAMLDDRGRLFGILPNTFEPVFREMGFKTVGYRKNFIEVHYEKD